MNPQQQQNPGQQPPAQSPQPQDYAFDQTSQQPAPVPQPVQETMRDPNPQPQQQPQTHTQQPVIQQHLQQQAQAAQPTAPVQPPQPPVAPAPMPAPAPQPQQIPTPMPAQPQPQKAGPLPPPKTNPNSTQNTLLIAEIRDGIAIMNDGSFRSVVMTKSINFDLMSPEEREAVEYSYQSFLNSLYFPIQIFVRSTKVDLRPYIEKLDKLRGEQENMLLALMMEDYIEFIDLLAQETNIMDKQFYIIMPYYLEVDTGRAVNESRKLLSGILKKPNTGVVTIHEGDLEKAKQELRNRVQSVMAGLQQIGVQAIPLDTEELIELYYDSYNPDTATRQRIRNFEQLTAPIITKGSGSAGQPQLDRQVQ